MKLEALAALRDAYQRCDDLDFGTMGLDLRVVEGHSALQAVIERNFDRMAASLAKARDIEPSLVHSIPHLDGAIRFGKWVADGRLIDERSSWEVRMTDLPRLRAEICSIIEQHGELH